MLSITKEDTTNVNKAREKQISLAYHAELRSRKTPPVTTGIPKELRTNKFN